jgi:hypothetical protein
VTAGARREVERVFLRLMREREPGFVWTIPERSKRSRATAREVGRTLPAPKDSDAPGNGGSLAR